MKKKVLCFALTVVMGLSMSTCAFARDEYGNTTVAKIGSGDVNGDGSRAADDCANILTYVLDHQYKGTDTNPFILEEANYDGNIDPKTGFDSIEAADCALLLTDVLTPTTDVYITVEAGKQNPVRFTEIINPDKSEGEGEDAKRWIEKTKALDVADTIMYSGDYDTELTNNASKVNDVINKIEFTGQSGKKASIKSDIGWSKFADAVGGVVTDWDAFAQLETSVKTKTYATADDLRADYDAAKKAFAPRESVSANSETAAKIKAITGADVVTVSKIVTDESGNETIASTIGFDELCNIVAENNLQKYDDVTIDQLQEIFGSKVLITAKNTSNGYENQVKVTVERR